MLEPSDCCLDNSNLDVVDKARPFIGRNVCRAVVVKASAQIMARIVGNKDRK